MADAPSYQTNSPSTWSFIQPLVQTAGAAAAGNTLAGGYSQAANTAQRAVDTGATALQPYQITGGNALTALQGLYGIGGKGPNYSTFYNSPGYQFAQQQGGQAIQRAANATGGGFSATTLADLAKYNSGLASQGFQQYVQNLYGLSGLGAGAATARGQQALTGAGILADAQIGRGNANASGVLGSTGALAYGLGRLFGGSSSDSGTPSYLSPTGQVYGGMGGAISDLYAPTQTGLPPGYNPDDVVNDFQQPNFDEINYDAGIGG
jgi:hypothetical protein